MGAASGAAGGATRSIASRGGADSGRSSRPVAKEAAPPSASKAKASRKLSPPWREGRAIGSDPAVTAPPPYWLSRRLLSEMAICWNAVVRSAEVGAG